MNLARWLKCKQWIRSVIQYNLTVFAKDWHLDFLKPSQKYSNVFKRFGFYILVICYFILILFITGHTCMCDVCCVWVQRHMWMSEGKCQDQVLFIQCAIQKSNSGLFLRQVILPISLALHCYYSWGQWLLISSHMEWL